MKRHVVRMAGQDLARASLLVRDAGGNTVVPAGPADNILGTTVATARAGQLVSIELLDNTSAVIAAGGPIQVNDPVMITAAGTVVKYQPGGKRIGVAITPGQPPGTVTVVPSPVDSGARIATLVGSPEGVLVGDETGQLVLEIDSAGVPVNLWRFAGTPGTNTGWLAFGSLL